jgi:uncharacterized protein (DUF488 family)
MTTQVVNIGTRKYRQFVSDTENLGTDNSKKIYCIGYGGCKATSDFSSTLKQSGVQVLVDIRYHPESAFSGEWKGSGMPTWLKEDGIDYVWMKELGNSFHHTEDSLDKFKEYLETNKDTCFNNLLAQEKVCAIMCACKDIRTCHRNVVAQMLKQQGIRVENLNPVKKGQQRITQFMK